MRFSANDTLVSRVTRRAFHECQAASKLKHGKGFTMIYFVIRSLDDDQLFWSNEFGWVATELETRFTEIERETYTLPINAAWVYGFSE
jgi:hypothetical protein